jgi:hypothetical protein
VYRFSRREIQKILFSMQTVSHWELYTTWFPPGSDAIRHFPEGRQLISPLAGSGLPARLLSSAVGLFVLRKLFGMVHFLVGYWGNMLILVAWKKPHFSTGAISTDAAKESG